MPFYHKLGKIPAKRHTQFRRADGGLYSEEVMGTRGFSGIQSILYHTNPPTKLKAAKELLHDEVEFIEKQNLEPRHIKASGFKSSGDAISSRVWLLGNKHVKIGLSTPNQKMQYFYRNGLCDEVIFVHKGAGKLFTTFGNLDFTKGDYIIIPVGTTYQLECNDCRLLNIESLGRIEIPKRYRNEYGQLLEHAPFCERDIRLPQELHTHETQGAFEVRVKMGTVVNSLTLQHHPFDVVGWDGYLYPWIFNISNFEPITGRVHQPPPVHQTFYSDGFVICSFVPRLYDYHPESIPVPYNHSNVNSDEVLYYVDGEFMSRKGIDSGSFTLHPAGIPHGPHPGTVEKSIGQKETKELAVMIDTFEPLLLTKAGSKLCDASYLTSWL